MSQAKNVRDEDRRRVEGKTSALAAGQDKRGRQGKVVADDSHDYTPLPTSNQSPTSRVLTALNSRGFKTKKVHSGATGWLWSCRCPSHRDSKPSLSIGTDRTGAAMLKCHAGCSTEAILAAVRLRPSDLFPHKGNPGKGAGVSKHYYVYRNVKGEPRHRTVRPEGEKQFYQEHLTPAGEWVSNMKHVRRLLYNLPEIHAAAPVEPIFVLEGEKDCDALARVGLIGTTNPQGAGSWSKVTDTSALHDRRVVLVPDLDKPGRDHMQDVGASLDGKCSELKWLELPGEAAGYDMSDWLSDGDGGDREQLLALVEQAPGFSPPAAIEPERTDLPVIDVTNLQLRHKTAAAIAALEVANDPPTIFQRSGFLTRVRAVPDEDGKLRPVIDTLDEHHLAGLLARAANFTRMSQKARSAIDPPKGVVRDIMALPSWRFPTILGTVEVPILRPDGTIVLSPGFDKTTGMYFAPQVGLEIPPIPDQPIDADIQQARDAVLEPVADFPFEDEPGEEGASLANTVALLLTPIIRVLIGDGCVPLAAITARARGTGKSLLADVAAQISTGRGSAVMTAPSDDAEWEKRITAMLSEGASFLVADNVTSVLRAAPLCAVLTCRRWRGRILGKTQTLDLVNKSTWVCNGNNLETAGDLPRRTYWIHLESTQARPWRRTGFKIPNLLPWVESHRGHLVSALLTLCRAWIVRGRPEARGLPVFGSFTAWASTIGGILQMANIPKFLANLDADQARQSVEDTEWGQFLERWYAAVGDRAVSVGELLPELGIHLSSGDYETNVITASENLPAELAIVYAEKTATFARRLGWSLKAHERERFATDSGTYYLERGTSKSWMGIPWCVRREGT